MKRLNALWLTLQVVVLLLFNTLYFTINIEGKSTIEWISYGTLHLIFVLEIVGLILTRTMYKIPFIKLRTIEFSSLVFLIELIASTIFILFNSFSLKQVLITQIIISGVYLLIFVAVLLFHEYRNEHTQDERENVLNSDLIDDSSENTQHEVIRVKKTSPVIIGLQRFLSNSSEWKVPNGINEFDELLNTATNCRQYTYDELNEIEQTIKEQTNALKIYFQNQSIARAKNVITELNTLLNRREEMILHLENDEN